jgi:hypothetical protein
MSEPADATHTTVRAEASPRLIRRKEWKNRRRLLGNGWSIRISLGTQYPEKSESAAWLGGEHVAALFPVLAVVTSRLNSSWFTARLRRLPAQ